MNVMRGLSFSQDFSSLYISRGEILTPVRVIIGVFSQEMGPVAPAMRQAV
jgi:hypothetical protein